MSAPFPLIRLFLSLVVALALAAVTRADDDPEPPNDRGGEPAQPAVDLEKAKTDKKLAAQAARDQAVSSKNLRVIGEGVHVHADRHGVLPEDIRDKNGKVLLSWRVALLPHIGQEKLYKQFKLDEPWDSRHNIKLLAKMPDVFRSARVKVKAKGNTVYQVFTGPNAVFERGRATRFPADIPDGTSNTLLAVEASAAVPWTKPGGIPFARNNALPDFGKAYGKRPLAVLLDGSVRVLDLNKIQAETLKNVIDPADGNVLGNDW